MKVKLNGKAIVENSYTEEQLADFSLMESLYIIRQLKAVILSNGEEIEVSEPNEHKQVFSKEFDIGFSEGEYFIQ